MDGRIRALRRRSGSLAHRMRDEAGGVTAEFVVALPVAIGVLGLCMAAINVGATQIALNDATADAARVVARGDDPQLVRQRLQSIAPGAEMSVDEQELVCVSVTAPVRVAGIDTPMQMSANACALGGGK